jgi:hypothetical protein
MAEIVIKNLDEDLRNKYKSNCAGRGVTMRDDLIDHIKKTVAWKEPKAPKTSHE